MNEVTFSSVCKSFHRHMGKKEMTTISRALLDIFTNDEKVLNEKNEPYLIDVKEYIEFFKGELEIYPNIKAAAKSKIYTEIEDDIIGIFDSYVVFEEYDDVHSELCELINADTSIEDWQRRDILSTKDIYQSVAKIYLYAICNNNKVATSKPAKKKNANVKSTLESLKEIISSLPKPVKIEVPEELDASEMTYVSAILEAFAEDAGVQIITQGDLLSKTEYSKYRRKLERYRQDYYAAESIRESLKDTNLSEEADLFDELKDETYQAVVDKAEEDYESSFKRMTETLIYVGTVSLGALLAQIPGWVQASQKKGLCHMLVNEERIRWKDE